MTTLPTTGPVTSPPSRPGALRMTPGRRVTLAIGVPIALVCIGWSAFSLVASIGQASFPVSTTIPVQNGRLVASTGGGDLNVRQGQASSGTARLTGRVDYSLVRPRFTASSSGISLHCDVPTGNCGLNATLDVPSHTAVDLNTGGGNVTASDLGGALKFGTGGGDVDGSGLFSPHVTTDSGGGNVTLVFTTVPDYVKVDSSGGDITIVVPRGTASYDIKSNASGGDYHASVPFNNASPHTIQVASGGGNINVTKAS
jgi:putative adhesin